MVSCGSIASSQTSYHHICSGLSALAIGHTPHFFLGFAFNTLIQLLFKITGYFCGSHLYCCLLNAYFTANVWTKGRLRLVGMLSKEAFPFIGPGWNFGGVPVKKKIQGQHLQNIHVLPTYCTGQAQSLEQNKALLL